MIMMQAVLDTNFWLATHVVVVTLGYASTFVAGLLGILYVVMGVFTPRLSEALSKIEVPKTPEKPEPNYPDGTRELGMIIGHGPALAVKGARLIYAGGNLVAAREKGASTATVVAKMIYGIICFATLFSFVGTVLGGIWADQSWGRFWGWDPKENGALIIVLWNALV